MKRKINEVVLKFFQDDANGEYGLTHKNTIDPDNGFNAFWDGKGIFHDVFEHWHEYSHKYFRGEYAMNIGGEMTAMGAMWYYLDELGVGDARLSHGFYSRGDNMRYTTENMIQEAIENCNSQFGSVLMSAIPKQKNSFNPELEDQIDLFWQNVKKFKIPESKQGANWNNEREIQHAIDYKKSVTKAKIAYLHRYGFKMARKMIPNCNENCQTLRDFISFWNDFTKRNNSEEMSGFVTEIKFKIYRENGIISWKAFAVLDPYSGAKRKEIEIHKLFSLDDVYQYY